ncbi:MULTISPECIES: hypothetical protein [Pirellulaceae]|nr:MULTISPECIES: hypothetical protein [Pirellulaceae]
MQNFRLVLAALGGRIVLSGLKVIVIEYDMNDSHDVSKAIGSIGSR